LPAADERVSFEEDIKPLFRPLDHESMAWAFDLTSYDEVKERLRVYLEQQQLEKAYDTWMKGIRDSAYVEIKTWSR